MAFTGRKLMTRAEAVCQLTTQWAPEFCTEICPLDQALGRVLAEDILSRNTLPVFRSAQGDGIAVKFSDFDRGIPDTNGWELGVDYAMADTGDDFPDAFDTVICIENLDFTAGKPFVIRPETEIKHGQEVSARGSNLREGEPLLKCGTRLNPFHLNLLASGGYTSVPVYRSPRVAYIPTGSELIPPGVVPKRGENIESNSTMVKAMLESWGAQADIYPHVKDIQSDLRAAIRRALESADIVLVNGGSSKGSEDYNEKIIKEYSSWYQHGIASIPGIPVLVALADGKPIINLPGPPFAAFSVMDWCVRTLVYTAQKQEPPQRATACARLTTAGQKPAGLELYLRLRVYQLDGIWQAEPLTWKNRPAEAMGLCNGLVVLPADLQTWSAGDMMEITLL